MTAFTTANRDLHISFKSFMLIWKTGEGAFSCSVSDRHGNMGKRKKKGNTFEQKKKKKKKKNVPDLFGDLVR